MRPWGGLLDGLSACLVVTEQRDRNGGRQAGWFNGMSGVAIPRVQRCLSPRLALFSFDSKKLPVQGPGPMSLVTQCEPFLHAVVNYNLDNRQNRRHGVSG